MKKMLICLSLVLSVFMAPVLTVHAQEEAVDPTKYFLVQLYADWCATCKTMAPVITQLQDEYMDSEVVFMRVDRTDDSTINQSMEALKLVGIGQTVSEVEGTGKVLVIDAESKTVVSVLNKTQSIDEMVDIINTLILGQEMKGSGMKEMKGSGSMEEKGSSPKGSMMEHKGSESKGSGMEKKGSGY